MTSSISETKPGNDAKGWHIMICTQFVPTKYGCRTEYSVLKPSENITTPHNVYFHYNDSELHSLSICSELNLRRVIEICNYPCKPSLICEISITSFDFNRWCQSSGLASPSCPQHLIIHSAITTILKSVSAKLKTDFPILTSSNLPKFPLPSSHFYLFLLPFQFASSPLTSSTSFTSICF